MNHDHRPDNCSDGTPLRASMTTPTRTDTRTPLQTIAADPGVCSIVSEIESGGDLSVRGMNGSSGMLVVAACVEHSTRPHLLVVAHLDEADDLVEELSGLGIDAVRFPAMEILPGESTVNIELLAERLLVLRRLASDPPRVLVAPIHALMQTVPDEATLEELLRIIAVGDRIDATGLAAWLIESGYSRVEALESPGEFAVRGGIVDIFPPSGTAIRIDLFGDEIEGIFEIDLDTMGSDRQVQRAEIVALTSATPGSAGHTRLLADAWPTVGVTWLIELPEITEQARSYLERATDGSSIEPVDGVLQRLVRRSHALLDMNRYAEGLSPDRRIDLPSGTLPNFDENATAAVGELQELAESHDVWVFTQNDGETTRMGELLAELTNRDGCVADGIRIIERYVHRGFVWQRAGERAIAIVPYHELLHRYQLRRHVKRIAQRATDTFLDLQPGDFVVHREHGIARFSGLQRLSHTPGAEPEEFLTLEFSGSTRLHVPATRIELVHRYIGAFGGKPRLSTMGGKRWSRQKEDVSEAVRALADEMLRVQAARAATAGIRYPADTPWQREFEAAFPYDETEDQLTAIEATKSDMADPQPMDRLICGDVGFGKTEVALRAAFKAAEYGKQVAILVPTTVLAEQHERTARQRFADYPFRVESLSRFKTPKQQRATIEGCRQGVIDILIGTHRLLSKDVRFADLGLVIIDEEQRFGVQHKNRLLEFRLTADVMTLSATPIPRTLHMAMLGLRDISALSTPPLDRRAIVTEVVAYDERRIKRAIERELAREGQVFFVHNRVHNIDRVADRVRALAPDARILIGHGQMPSRQLEDVMLRFMRREADILVCTTIIESGIDIPTANTMFINDADIFGLAELHQLRGRVGRYKHRAYCYLLLPRDRTVSDVAIKRLRAIEQFSMLGAGFKIALRDLELRGAGNLLGAEQSGHIATVGYEMYCKLLEQAVAEQRQESTTRAVETTVELGLTGTLPKGYIPSDLRRMEAYRRLSAAQTPEMLDELEADLRSAYGPLPRRAETLLRLGQLRVAAARLGIRAISRRDDDVHLLTTRPGDLEPLFAGSSGTLRVVGQPRERGRSEVYFRPPANAWQGETILSILLRRLRPDPVK